MPKAINLSDEERHMLLRLLSRRRGELYRNSFKQRFFKIAVEMLVRDHPSFYNEISNRVEKEVRERPTEEILALKTLCEKLE